jgi:hypothetical protein
MGRFFQMANDPVKMAETALGALTFLRGDVQAAQETVARRLTEESLVEALRSNLPDDRHPYSIPHLLGRLALVHRTAIARFDAEAVAPAPGEVDLPQGVIVSDTNELVWTGGEGKGRVLVDTPRCQAVIGHKGSTSMANLALELETPFAAVQLVSLEDAPIAQAKALLLLTGARVANTGMRWLDEGRQSLGDHWGEAPTRIEPVTGVLSLVELQGARRILLQALDGRGQPVGAPHPCAREGAGNKARFVVTLPLEQPTLWYRVQVER